MPTEYRFSTTVTIPSSSTHLSDAASIMSYRIKAIQMPAAWSSAIVTFQGSLDGVTFQDVYDDAGVQISATAAAAENIALTPIKGAQLASFNYLKLRSGTSSAGDEQAAARTMTLILMPASAG